MKISKVQLLMASGFFMLSLGCSNLEDLVRDKFQPDYATKHATTFLVSKPVNGRFLKIPLSKDQPLMLLKRGLGYSVCQLYGGSVGEVPTESLRLRREGEKFETYYVSLRPQTNSKPVGTKGFGSYRDEKRVGGEGERVETFPILNNFLDPVEPELPEW